MADWRRRATGFAWLGGFLAAGPWLGAAPLTVSVSPPPTTPPLEFKMGTASRRDGRALTLDSRSLRLDGKPWTPVMGEFHYARYPENEWREELLKMKAGGVDIVATYVFWIHHEEIEGQFDWSGRRNLRRFIETCGAVGLKAIVRCGPWCHGEVRNGGTPDWVLQKGWRNRSNDPDYLGAAQRLYREIAGQLRGSLWKDGGPVIGIQFENEYYGPAEHLLTLKRIAREAGLDVPLYTRTGWPALTTPMPFGEIVPLYGVYAEGFWDRDLTPMPSKYWAGFHFSALRVDNNIANELLGHRDARDDADAEQYPFLTCEIGGGMMNSYHRRIRVNPADIESTTLVKLGSGSTSPGYYMYHGGVNPEGRLSTMMESQATRMWNDLPVKSYDFQAPLGEYGQVRPHYHQLRRLHLFLREWGPMLATLPAVMPDQRPAGKRDFDTLRWCVRSDGNAGFVFVNNYERLQTLPAKSNVQFSIKLAAGALTFPDRPVAVPAGSRFLWPFNFDLGHGVRLAWASAQPVTALDVGRVRTVFFAKTPGVPAEFAIEGEGRVEANSGHVWPTGGRVLVSGVTPGRGVAFRVRGAEGGSVQVVLLSAADSLAVWKGNWQGRDRVFLTDAGVALDGDTLRLSSNRAEDMSVGVFPACGDMVSGQGRLGGRRQGVFHVFQPKVTTVFHLSPTLELLRAPGPAREIPLGKIKTPVAAAPEDSDFAQAAVWRVRLPAGLTPGGDLLLRLGYVGDVARVTLNGKLLTDDFYNGNAFEIGLKRHAPEIFTGDLRVEILPLRKDAPIYLSQEAWPEFGTAGSAVEMRKPELLTRYTIHLRAADAR